MEPKAKQAYERYVAARGGMKSSGPMVRWQDLRDQDRQVWEAVINEDAPRQECHGSLLPPVTGTLNAWNQSDELKT